MIEPARRPRRTVPTSCLVTLASALALSALGAEARDVLAGEAPAAGPTDPATEAKLAEAKKLYEEGSAAFSRNEFAGAAASLQRSFDLVPSPTAELMLARALRENGKLADAASHFSSCEAAARARVAKGDDRFKSTADDAATEGAAVRAKVGALDVSVAGASVGDTLEVEGRAIAIEGGKAPTIFHEPGNVAVTFKPTKGAPSTQTVMLEAGKPASMSFDVKPEPLKPVPVEPTPSSRKKWAVPGAIAAGGVTAVGAGLFIGFGLKSSSIWSDLKPCAGHCSPSVYGDKARSGASAQNVANAGLAIGLVGAAACGTFVVLAVTDHPSKPADGKPGDVKPVALSITPGGAFVRGEF